MSCTVGIILGGGIYPFGWVKSGLIGSLLFPSISRFLWSGWAFCKISQNSSALKFCGFWASCIFWANDLSNAGNLSLISFLELLIYSRKIFHHVLGSKYLLRCRNECYTK